MTARVLDGAVASTCCSNINVISLDSTIRYCCALACA